ncbi:hypothetical protein P3102_19105 [Amycolatopsis sp. QT-25]|uniref:hypothetical protein n=1 Tax=Amycolatopsis sp. QT-25 TaxID=3034022 RepID=UPI0023ED30D4|nr:hypothetical protein [Amycolatopsis sp. QT-25]WET76243.1 hypothetical protein P3102_19105 [Amycolatopsis sp. QT-25]
MSRWHRLLAGFRPLRTPRRDLDAAARWFRSTTFDEAAAAPNRQRVLWQRYRTFEELGRDLDLFGEADRPGAGPHLAPKSPILVGGGRLSAPSIGRHNAELL